MTAPQNKSEFYSLPQDLDRSGFLRRITTDKNFVLSAPEKKREEFFDTFDRRLHSANLTLIKEGASYHLKSLVDGSTVATVEQKNSTPKFWWDFPKCALRSELKPHCSIRALLSLANIERSVTTLRLQNEDKKTVLFLHLKDLRLLDGARSHDTLVIQIKPVRGYEQEAKEFKNYILSLGLKPSSGDLLSQAASYHGKYPLDYSSKINVHLRPDMKSEQAAKIIFTNLLETMRVNEFGIKEDIDTEFLHDFRVAVRRTRSALSQIKAVFSPGDTEKYKSSFSEIGKATNELRDLDVYLLTEDSYKNMLPEDLRSGLDPMFEKLADQREKVCRSCSEFLESAKYRDAIKSWEEFLNNSGSDPEQAPNSARPIIELAKEHIWKKYSKVIKLGKKINRNTPDPEVHELRIECKKLRYLLEFFTSLFPQEDMKIIIKHLKVLQDNLGDFNDLHVQQESLKKFLSSQDIGYDQSKQRSLAAAGGLVSVLYQKQMGTREKFKENFHEFADKETSRLFEKLFT